MTCAMCRQPMVPQHSEVPADHVRHNGRGLCGGCYSRAEQAGTLADYPRRQKPRADLLEDWELLRSEGYSVQHAAERLGMTHEAMRKALRRAGVAA